MAVTVNLKNLHISPRKVRLVAGLVRGEDISKAVEQLEFTNKGATKSLLKLLNSAIATAKNDFEFSEDNLYISEILVNEGPTMKRWRPRAHGRAYPIMKRSSHVVLKLEEKVKSKDSKSKKPAKKKASRDDVIKADELDKKIKDSKKDKVASRKKNNDKKFKSPQKGSKLGNKPGNEPGLINKVFRRKSI